MDKMKNKNALISFERLKQRNLLKKFFDPEFYMNTYPDVKSWRGNLIDHYIKFGSHERRSPHMFFDAEWYCTSNPEIDFSVQDPVTHYLNAGEKKGRWPHPLFNPEWYRDRHLGKISAGISSFEDFIVNGLRDKREFSPFFDVEWYNAMYPNVAEAGQHPGVHFLTEGFTGSYNPSKDFSSLWYLDENPDVQKSGVNPFMHFLKYGRAEGRLPLPYFSGRLSAESVGKSTFGSLSFEEPVGEADREPSLDGLRCLPSIDLAQIKYVSFDVWNTLIHRECHSDEVKLQSARYVLLNAGGNLKPAYRYLRDIYRARLRAENASAPKGDFEYRFSDAIDGWLSEILSVSTMKGTFHSLKSGLLRHEYNAELRGTHRDCGMATLIAKLSVPHIFISDFYTSSDFIENLLSDNGVSTLWAKGYSSSDTFENKRGGALFGRVLTDLDLKPAEMLHLGDNPRADKAIPESLGINSVLYEAKDELKRHDWYGAAFAGLLQGDNTKHHRRLLAIVDDLVKSAGTQYDSEEAVELYEAGIQLSLISFSFCLSVLEDAVSRKVDDVFFFTREGIFLKKVFDAIAKEDPYNTIYPQASVLDVSRRATFAASLEDYSVSEMMRLWTMYSSQSISGFTSSLNLQPKIVKSICRKYDVDFNKAYDAPWSNKDFQLVMQDAAFKEHAQAAISSQKFLLKGYLRQSGLLSEKFKEAVVVDIGWRGTIQDNLARLTDNTMHGHYLALFKFLNDQNGCGTKAGWLSDANTGDLPSLADQVAPLEMIFNGKGGSVVGYELVDGSYRSIKQIDEEEEQVVTDVGALQAGMFDAIPALARYVRLHGLLAEHLKPLAQKLAAELIGSPPRAIADLFARLKHNETFGVGSFQTVGGKRDLGELSKASSAREVHSSMTRWLDSVRWRSGALKHSSIPGWWAASSDEQRSSAPLDISRLCSPAVNAVVGERLAVYVPGVLRASGGHRTIFNMIRRFADLGMDPYVFLDGVGAGVNVAEDYLAGTPARLHTNWGHNITSTVAFATIAHSAEYVRQNVRSQHKFYLVQDAEALFNPIGDEYVIAENSYAQGLHHVTIGNWLTHVIQNRYMSSASPAGLGVDTNTYRMSETTVERNGICMLYQPEKPRRGNHLAIAALKIFKANNPDVPVYLFGSNEYAAVDFEAEQLGIITDLRELNRLYNKCTTGICISLSNPSRIPFEMMAAGCIPVDVFRYNNLMDYENETGILAYQDAASIAEALDKAFAVSTTTYISNMVSKAETRTLLWENDTIVGNVLSVIENGKQQRRVLKRSYTAPPVIAKSQQVEAVQAFCNWQANMADASS
jgi:FMN phosphatase YigB (HAD superfamily)